MNLEVKQLGILYSFKLAFEKKYSFFLGKVDGNNE